MARHCYQYHAKVKLWRGTLYQCDGNVTTIVSYCALHIFYCGYPLIASFYKHLKTIKRPIPLVKPLVLAPVVVLVALAQAAVAAPVAAAEFVADVLLQQPIVQVQSRDGAFYY